MNAFLGVGENILKKPSNPKGMRDFNAEQVRKRNFLFKMMEEVFELYGFQPIETPVMENLQTLTGKYGEEGDRLLFKVLNNGDYLKKADSEALEARDSFRLTSSIAKRGLRYDLTVPFARYVVQHQNDLIFPFKRYQIQPVWRADRPQKGRYQEFYQCDVDVIGTTSLLNEAELVQIYDEVFHRLGIQVIIRVNNRKLLEGLAHYAGHPDKMTDLTVAIDKLDKFKDGWTGLFRELEARGISSESHPKIKEVLTASHLDELRTLLKDVPVAIEGIEELETLRRYLERYSFHNTLKFDFTLARGLNYYTGTIIEVILDTSVDSQTSIKMGSLGGGGRYDDLTGIFGLPNMSGVGVSFGAERIYDVMEALTLFPKELSSPPLLLLIALDAESQLFAFEVTQQLRQANIKAEIYPDLTKLKKPMKYANARHFAYVALIGEDERQRFGVTLKNMTSGEQQSLSVQELIDFFHSR